MMNYGEGITVAQLLEEYGEKLALELKAGAEGLGRMLHNGEVHRPGLALAGFVDLYTFDRVQVLGNTEMFYLGRLSKKKRRIALETIYQFDLPCVVLTNNADPFPEMVELSNSNDIPLLVTRFATTKFVHLFSYYLEDHFSPWTTVHGSLVDVYGVGLLFVGKSGIGKSEVALDLIERGHRLVADDVVRIVRRARGILVGMGKEAVRHYMEIRGVGIVDVQRMFGIQAVRDQKRVEVEVRLVEWNEVDDYERIGLSENYTTILDVEIPSVTVPIYPGKNITVIAEVIALNYLLKVHGIHPVEEFNEKLIKLMQERRALKRRLSPGPALYAGGDTGSGPSKKEEG
ncbi:MAG: HPr kinase/phosphorylase [Candidatus Latescibacterota bacterium]|nr:MAG: HPr kinase/phosphorylase [Candidatus Latescibacterota bacterium]RKY65928.1 MAG: HPr kinase/phosphorylase [Candidatus Latescibacterota bacterium]